MFVNSEKEEKEKRLMWLLKDSEEQHFYTEL